MAQEATAVAPDDERNWPRGQATQSIAPVSGWYCPAGQVGQLAAPELGWSRPEAQRPQLGWAGAAEDEPAGQLLQRVVPVEPWYLPAVQPVHATVPVPAV